MAVSVPISVSYDVEALRASQFPVARHSVYLNHAGISPLPRRTYEAMRQVDEQLMTDPMGAFESIMARLGQFKEAFRDLINAQSADEIVAVQSTSLGLSVAAQALPWQRGQNIILCDVEFPSNVYPWMRLTGQHGVEVRLIPARDGGLTVEALAEATDDNTRLVAASAVQFLTGHRTDLKAVGDFCAARGILFVVDAIQAAGHIPIDVQAMHIDILASGGQKSLMGPPGQGFLYVRSGLCAQMQPTIIGPNAVEDFLHWIRYDMTPLPGAARFEMGTSNPSGQIGLLESVNMLRELSVAAIDAYTTALAAYTIERLRALGYEVITPEAHGPIVTFRAAPTDEATTALVEALNARRIYTVRHWDKHDVAHVRASLHCYNTPEDIDRLIAALQEINAKEVGS